MKKLIYIFISLLWLVSCTEDNMQLQTDSSVGDNVTYTLGMSVPEIQQAESRALGEWDMNAASSVNLQVVVFDANHFFAEAVDATYVSNDSEKVIFSVTLSATEEKRIAHFILNSPKASAEYTFGMEHELIGQLATQNQEPAYWQRLELPDGTAVYQTDDEGNVSVSAPASTLSLFQEIPMIRNFAKLTVENKADNFELLGFTIVNAWDKGTVAPYNQTGGTSSFVVFHNEDKTGRTYSDIVGDGYEGTTPSGVELTNVAPTDESFYRPDATYYMYERRNTYDDTNPTPATFMLVKGKFDGGDYYYKVDLIYELENSGGKMQYYNVLRNFHYHVIINGVNGYGYETAAEAASHPAANNLNNSIDIRDITNIAATVDDRLFVSYTDTTLVNTGTVQVKYRFIDENVTANDRVTIEEVTAGAEQDCLSAFSKNGTDGDWQIVDVTFDKMPQNEQVYTNTLRFVVYKELTDGTEYPYLSREVDFNLRRSMNMIVQCNPRRVPEGVDEEVTVNILIPTGITASHDPYQLFPLEFLVEAEELTLYPNVGKNEASITLSPSEMPVRTGASIIDGVTENTFRYVRTITLDEYNQLLTKEVTVKVGGSDVTGTYKVIPCHFKTNKAVSATAVYAQNKYFTLIQPGSFINADGIITDASLTESYYYAGKNVTVRFRAGVAGTYTITSDHLNGSATVELSAGEVYTSPEGTFTTRTWADAGTVTVTFEDGDFVEITSSTSRTILQMWARSATYNDVYVGDDKHLGMYSTEENAKNQSVTPLASVNAKALTTGYTNVTIADLQEDTPLYFSYVNGDYLYVASATAGALADKTADLAFSQYSLPTIMSASFGNGTQYYGVGKTFTLTFTTNKAGTYTISNVEGSVSNNVLSYSNPSTGLTLNSNNTFTVTAAGTYTLTCTTKTWATQAAVYITLNDVKTSAIGSVRNTLKLTDDVTVTGTNDSNRTLNVTYSGNTGQSGTIETDSRTSNRRTTYFLPMNEEIVLAGIPSENEPLTFSYIRNKKTYSDTITADDLINGKDSLSLK